MKLKHAFTEMTITLGWNNAAGNIHELKTLLCINIFIILGRKIIHHTTYEYGWNKCQEALTILLHMSVGYDKLNVNILNH